ncbi:MAG TPA: MBL fold metallo-hydrolase [Polyangiaceae bacterium]|nr:MBL fold metallo-hydrolase [Polyangiaceae bacterium]
MLSAVRSVAFPRFVPAAAMRPTGAASGAAGLRFRWLGTAGFVVEAGATTIVIDPYLSRPSARTLLTSRVSPDERAVRASLPARVDAVLCGHSHFDHLLDAPLAASLTGAKLVGSETTLAFGRAHGLPEGQLVHVPARGLVTTIGDIEIRFVPSLHGRILLGRVPFPGVVSAPPRVPARAWHYRMGGAFGILLGAGDAAIYHNGSADLVDAELDGLAADVLLVGIAGWRSTPNYVPRLVRALAPKVVVPCHHDAFFAPLRAGVRLWPGVDVAGFVAEVRHHRTATQIVTPLYDDVVRYDARGRHAFVERA